VRMDGQLTLGAVEVGQVACAVSKECMGTCAVETQPEAQPRGRWQKLAVRVLGEVECLPIVATLLVLPSVPLSLMVTCVWYVVFVAAGLANPTFTFRGGGAGGLLFALVIGPLLLTEYASDGVFPGGSAASVDLVCLGSLQALFDFAVHLGPRQHTAQVVCFVVLGAVFMLPTGAVTVFLTVQKLATLCLFRRDCWGHCFSPSEGLFWAQLTAMLCATLVHGAGTAFTEWTSWHLFSAMSVAFGLVFLMLTASVGSCSRWLPFGREWSAVVAGGLTAVLFVAWLVGILGAWGSASTPLAWCTGLLQAAQPLRLFFLQWPLILSIGVTSIDVLARSSLALNGGTGSDSARVKVLYRKAFHVLAVALFVPPLLSGQEVVLSLALVAAALVFMVVETCRLYGTPWLASRLNVFMRRYLDKRENTERGDLVLTHLYLLVGCAVPLWLELGSSATGAQPSASIDGMDLLRRAAGIILIGVGDAFAAAYGVNFGKLHWPGSHRTVEGSLAFVVGVIATALTLSLSQTVGTCIWQEAEIKAFVCAVALSMFLEVYTDSIDNLVLPLYFSPTLRILTRAMK